MLLTPHGDLGGRDLWYSRSPSDIAENRFAVRISSARANDLMVSWLVLD